MNTPRTEGPLSPELAASWRELVENTAALPGVAGAFFFNTRSGGPGLEFVAGEVAADTAEHQELAAWVQANLSGEKTSPEHGGREVLAETVLGPRGEIMGLFGIVAAQPHEPWMASHLGLTRKLMEKDLVSVHLESKAEEAVFLRAVMDNVTQAFLVIQDGVIQYFNSSLEQLTGYTSEEILNQPFAQFLHPEDRQATLERHQQRVAGQRPSEAHDMRIITKRGNSLWVIATASLFTWRGVPSAMVMLTDISERKRAEASLRQAEQKYRELFINAPVAIFRSTPQGRFISVNPAYARIAGYDSPEQMLGSITDIASQMYVDPARRDEYKSRLENDGTVENFEVLLKRRDGVQYWASMTTRATRGQDGEILSYDGFLMDVTEEKEHQALMRDSHAELERQVTARTRQLSEANQALTELNTQMSSFLSSASHELRTPLTSVLGFAKVVRKTFARHFLSLAQHDPKLVERAATIDANLDVIGQEGERLTRLVNDLLDMNKIEAGSMSWRDQELDAHGLLLAAAASVQGRFHAAPEVSLVTDFAEDLPALCADPDRITQVLVNLLDNAVKFTRQGQVTMSAKKDGQGHLEIRVIDQGPGIPEQHRDLVFDKFFQSHGSPDPNRFSPDTYANKPKGTGLGLAICRRIVSHYQGSIHVEPGPGGLGACFVVVLPGLGPR
ncbi:MAG: PAS domain-containing sensor histidine kinase [Desulfovibrio sp.]|nr:MAG: PAS domain-containing sensor histidine kinase [Desulfovibrio sp.]